MLTKKRNYWLALSCCFLLSACIVETLEAPFNMYRKGMHKEGAEAGDPESMYEYGIAYCCGSAPYYSNRIGTRWLCRAARAGHTQAMADMAYWWRKDKGFPSPGFAHTSTLLEDNAVAYAWYAVAARDGHSGATTAMYEVEEDLSPKELERAKRYIAHFPDMPCEMY